MIGRALVRPTITFVVCFTVGLLVVVFVLGEDRGPPRRGMHVQTISGTTSGSRPAEETPWSQLPVEGPVDKPVFCRYEEVVFPSGERRKVVAWSARAGSVTFGADGREFVASDVVFRVYARPRAPEEVRRKPVVLSTIRAPRARAREEEGQLVLRADRAVNVVSSAGGRSSTLDAEDLLCRLSDRTLHSRGRVRIVSDRYTIEGTGLEGNVDLASTFEVRRDVTATLPTAALLGPAASGPGAVTVIRSPGPMLMEKFKPERGGPVPLRVTFDNGVDVIQNENAPAGPDTLRARSLVLDLTARKAAAGGADQVSLSALDARGEVVLTRGRESRITGDRLVLRTSGEVEEAALSGPTTVHHEGPGAGGGEAAPARETLDLRAGGGGTLRRVLRTGELRSEFRGGVHVERGRTGSETRELVLDGDTVALRQAPGAGPDLAAEGGVRFATPTATGTAGHLRWSRRGEERTGLLLTGDPRVELRAGSSLGLPGEGIRAPVPDSRKKKTILRCRGPLALLAEGGDHCVSLDERCRLEEIEGDVILSVLEADYLSAFVSGTKVKNVWAVGDVTARGQGASRPVPKEGQDAGREGKEQTPDRREYQGRGEEFLYRADTGRAVLLGRPAVVRLTETSPWPGRPPGKDRRRADEIRARRLTFDNSKPLLTGQGEVDALVYLRSAGTGRFHPFHLACGRLDLTPRREVPKGVAASDLGGRILALSARGHVALEGREQTGTGTTLTYASDSGEVILDGSPAELVREQVIAGRTYRDLFRAGKFRMGLAGGDLHSFRSSPGGRFRFHRPYQPGPALLSGEGGKKEKKDKEKGSKPEVERIEAAGRGPLVFDGSLLTLSGEPEIHQFLGRGGQFRRVGGFTAHDFRAHLMKDASGALQLLRAEGRGDVHGTGEGFELWCERFSTDLGKHETTIEGTPARLLRQGREQTVRRAVYDYVNEQWTELYGARTR